MLCAYVSYLPLLHSGNKMLYLCHYRRAGAYRVGRTRRPHCLLLPRRGEIENWVKTELVSWFSWVEFDRKPWSLLRLNSTQLNWAHSQMCRITELATGPVELRWVVGCDHSAWSDSTQPVELSWVELSPVGRCDQGFTLSLSWGLVVRSVLCAWFSLRHRHTYVNTALHAYCHGLLFSKNLTKVCMSCRMDRQWLHFSGRMFQLSVSEWRSVPQRPRHLRLFVSASIHRSDCIVSAICRMIFP